MTFTVGTKTYEIAFSIGRVDMFEKSHEPILAVLTKNRGLLSIANLNALIACGLREEGGEWINPGDGLVMAENLLEANGYATMYKALRSALERDCGFFFKAMGE